MSSNSGKNCALFSRCVSDTDSQNWKASRFPSSTVYSSVSRLPRGHPSAAMPLVFCLLRPPKQWSQMSAVQRYQSQSQDSTLTVSGPPHHGRRKRDRLRDFCWYLLMCVSIVSRCARLNSEWKASARMWQKNQKRADCFCLQWRPFWCRPWGWCQPHQPQIRTGSRCCK